MTVPYRDRSARVNKPKCGRFPRMRIQEEPIKMPTRETITFGKYSSQKNQFMTFSIPLLLPSQTSVVSRISSKTGMRRLLRRKKHKAQKDRSQQCAFHHAYQQKGLSWKKGKHLILNEAHFVLTSLHLASLIYLP